MLLSTPRICESPVCFVVQLQQKLTPSFLPPVAPYQQYLSQKKFWKGNFQQLERRMEDTSEKKLDYAYESGLDSTNDYTTETGKMNLDSAGYSDRAGCLVCGDTARCNNFGVITCESCKAFFRRNREKGSISCPLRGDCLITVGTRKRCPQCRLRRCFKVGMNRDINKNQGKSLLIGKRKGSMEETLSPASQNNIQNIVRPTAAKRISEMTEIANSEVAGPKNSAIWQESSQPLIISELLQVVTTQTIDPSKISGPNFPPLTYILPVTGENGQTLEQSQLDYQTLAGCIKRALNDRDVEPRINEGTGTDGNLNQTVNKCQFDQPASTALVIASGLEFGHCEEYIDENTYFGDNPWNISTKAGENNQSESANNRTDYNSKSHQVEKLPSATEIKSKPGLPVLTVDIVSQELQSIKLEELQLANEVWNIHPRSIRPLRSACAANMTHSDFSNLIHYQYSKAIKEMSSFGSFLRFPMEDRIPLLKARIPAVLLVRSSSKYHEINEEIDCSYPGTSRISLDVVKRMHGGTLDQTRGVMESFPKQFRFHDTIRMIISAIVMFNADSLGVTYKKKVEYERDIYLQLFQQYLKTEFGPEEGYKLYLESIHWITMLNVWVKHNAPGLIFDLNPETLEILLFEITCY